LDGTFSRLLHLLCNFVVLSASFFGCCSCFWWDFWCSLRSLGTWRLLE
jgi:hypothetical protein